MSIFKKKNPKYKIHFDEKKGEMVLGENTPKKTKSMSLFKKKKLSDSTKILLLTSIVFISVYTYRNYLSNQDYSIQKYITFQKSIIENTTFQNNTDDTGKLKEFAKAITSKCNNEKNCEIENLYKYVTNIPYYTSDKPTKTPTEVIATNSGDCDEKSFLLATLLKEKKHNSLLIFTKQNEIYHTFLGIETNKQNTDQKNTFLKINNKKYYYAETTWNKSYIGEFNGYNKKDIVGIYDIENKKNISIKKIEFIKNS